MRLFALLPLIMAAATAPLLAADAIVRSEFIFESAPFPQCHASTIAETKSGFVAAWFGGTRESHPDVCIWASRLIERKWSAPVEVANGIGNGKRFPCWNPVLFQPREGPLLLFYKVGASPSQWWAALLTSDDGGESWSKPQRLPDGFAGPIKNKPAQLASGDILCPSSSEDHGWRVHFERTPDLGQTWTKSGPINDGKTIAAIQPSILFHAGNRLQALGRSQQGKLWEAWSSDEGHTWSEMKLLDLPNPNSGTDAVTLRDGRHLLVFNNTPKGRTPLTVAVSTDGRAWTPIVELEKEPGEFSYPAVIQSSDGLIHVTYTWKRQRIKHAVLDPKHFPQR